MVSDEDYKQFYASGTQASSNKLLKKFEDKAAIAVEKLKSPEVQAGWQKNVSSAEALQKYKSKVSKLNASDLIEPMKSRGIAAYTRSTGDPQVQNKWLNHAKPYIEVAQQFSKEKKVVTSEADAIENMTENMRRMKAKFKELNG